MQQAGCQTCTKGELPHTDIPATDREGGSCAWLCWFAAPEHYSRHRPCQTCTSDGCASCVSTLLAFAQVSCYLQPPDGLAHATSQVEGGHQLLGQMSGLPSFLSHLSETAPLLSSSI